MLILCECLPKLVFFEETLKFEGDAGEIWKRASAVREIPNYWHGTRSLEVVGESGVVVHAKVRFAFGGSGEADISTDDDRRTLTINYRSGPFTGKQTLIVNDGSMVARWDVKFRGVFRLASRWNESHFRSGTVHALQRLVEGQDNSPEKGPQSRRHGIPKNSERFLAERVGLSCASSPSLLNGTSP